MTNQKYTNEILSGYLMNNDRLNTEYLFLQVDIHTSNTKRLYDFMHEKSRIKVRNVAINLLKAFVNSELRFSGYAGYECTNAQLMKFDKEHGNGLTEVLDMIETWIIEERKERESEA